MITARVAAYEGTAHPMNEATWEQVRMPKERLGNADLRGGTAAPPKIV